MVIRLSALGDVAMLVPVLRVLLEENPDVKITVLSKKFLQPLFSEKIVGKKIHFLEADTQGRHKGILGLFRLSREVKKLGITDIADTHNVLRSKVLRSFLFGIRNAVIDKGRKEKKALTRVKNKVFKQLKTTHERYADVFRDLGYPIDISAHKFPKKSALPDSSYLKELPVFAGAEDGKKWIGIAPFAKHQGKMYPLDLMEQVVAQLSKNNHIFLFGGGKKETAILNKITDKNSNTYTIASKLNLAEELDLIANLDAMLSMDSGNAHFAAMLGIKTLTLWGATHPFAGFAPFQQQEYCILPDMEKYPNLPCSVYGNKICEGYEDVMRSIAVDTILSYFK